MDKLTFVLMSVKWLNKIEQPLVGMSYSRVHKSSDSFFSKILEKPSIVQKKMIPHIKGLDFSQRWSKKKIQNGRLRKFKMATSKKTSFSSSANSEYFFMKISWISPLVSRIDWCKGHWFCSTHMAVRLANVSSKTGKKCIFCVFRPFLSLCRPASRPHGLSKINALCINQSY